MAMFVLHRNYTLRTVDGVISFKAGEPTYVVPSMVKHAIGIGAQPVEGTVDVIEPEVTIAPAPAGDERVSQLYVAFEQIVKRNDAKDFTAQGIPTVKAVEKLVNFNVDSKEIAEAYYNFRTPKDE